VPLPTPSQTPAPAVLPGWDEFDAYLFDIDGTLLREPNRIHVNAFSATLREVLQRDDISLNGVTVHGSTDAAILRDACRNAGVDDAHWQPLEQTIFSRLSEMVHTQREQMEVVLMPGVVPMLEYLAGRGASAPAISRPSAGSSLNSPACASIFTSADSATASPSAPR